MRPVRLPATGQQPQSVTLPLGKGRKLSLAPGETLKVPVMFQSDKKQDDFSSKVVINSNDPTQAEVKVEVKAFVKRMVWQEPAGGIVIRTLDAGPGVSSKVHLENRMPEPLQLEYSGTNIPGLQVQIDELSEGRIYDVTATMSEKLEPGTLEGAVVFRTGWSNEPQLIVPVWLTLIRYVEASPRAIYVDPVQSQPKKKTVSLQFYGDAATRATSATCTLPDVQVTLGRVQKVPPRGKPGRLIFKAYQRATVIVPPASKIPPEGVYIEFTTTDPQCPTVKVLVTTNKQQWSGLTYGRKAGRLQR